jgi:molybdate transport system substrate-binding protein
MAMRRVGSLLLWLCVLSSAAVLPARAADTLVFAASSLGGALDDVVIAYRQQGGKAVMISYAASSALAKQIEQGAPADIFISADEEWLDYLAARGKVLDGSRHDLLGNRLVLVAPAGTELSITLSKGVDLLAPLGRDGRLAIADPDHVPAGRYAQAALTALGAWSAVQGRLARADNVRAALAFVARGETPLGVVYATDALAEPKVHAVGLFPENSHPSIIYGTIRITGSAAADGAKFFDFLTGPVAREIFLRRGFTPPHRPAS